jgi:AraC-like DNA-binding protein
MRTPTDPSASGFTVAGSLFTALLRRAAEHHVPGEALLAAAGLTRAALDQPEARVPRGAYHLAFERAAALAGQPDFGLLCGERPDLEAFHVVGHLLAGQPTVGAALERLIAFQRLLDDASSSALRRAGERATFVTLEPSPALARPRHAAEFAVAAFITNLRLHTAGRFAPTRVAFVHPRPASLDRHVRFFRVVPEFAAAAIEVEMDASALALPLVSPLVGLARHLERYAGELLARLVGDDLPARVKRTVLAALPAGPPSLQASARALGTSPRTLQRRLAALGETFQAIVDRARHEAVQHYLEHDDSKLDHVAAAVGFTDARSLRRASRRWFGSGASAVRRTRRPP